MILFRRTRDNLKDEGAMVADFSHADLQIKISKTGHQVPVVNDVHLHSIYNPIKEAEAFLEKNKNVIQQKNLVLILGLGFAYHINLVVKLMEETFGENFEIAVVEPHLALAKECLTGNHINDHRITIYSKPQAALLYTLDEFVSFLMRGPSVLTHTASFNLHERYFRDLLAYRAPDDLKSLTPRIKDENLKKYFNLLPGTTDLNSLLATDIKKKNEATDAEDFLLLAFARMSAGKKPVEVQA